MDDAEETAHPGDEQEDGSGAKAPVQNSGQRGCPQKAGYDETVGETAKGLHEGQREIRGTPASKRQVHRNGRQVSKGRQDSQNQRWIMMRGSRPKGLGGYFEPDED